MDHSKLAMGVRTRAPHHPVFVQRQGVVIARRHGRNSEVLVCIMCVRAFCRRDDRKSVSIKIVIAIPELAILVQTRGPQTAILQ